MRKTIIHLEDNGQDFLRFTVDEHCRVTKAEPFQTSIWEGAFIPVYSDMCEVGKPCPIHNERIHFGFLKYKIERIEKL